tara:strand:- start:118 stop:459 length:342 start_codon:yes stop_codon:yes gene_type:complete
MPPPFNAVNDWCNVADPETIKSANANEAKTIFVYLCTRRAINTNALKPRPAGDKNDEIAENLENIPVFAAPFCLSALLSSSLNKNRYSINAGAKTNQYDECSPAEIPAGNKNA